MWISSEAWLPYFVLLSSLTNILSVILSSLTNIRMNFSVIACLTDAIVEIFVLQALPFLSIILTICRKQIEGRVLTSMTFVFFAERSTLWDIGFRGKSNSSDKACIRQPNDVQLTFELLDCSKLPLMNNFFNLKHFVWHSRGTMLTSLFNINVFVRSQLFPWTAKWL